MKLDELLKHDNTNRTGEKACTQISEVYGNKNSKFQIIHRISFGGASIKIDESYKIALDFIEKIKENIDNSSVKYSIHSPSL